MDRRKISRLVRSHPNCMNTRLQRARFRTTLPLIGLIVVVIAWTTGLLAAQQLEFEVVSIKRKQIPGPDRMDVSPRRSGDLVMMHNTQPSLVILYAYRLKASEIQGSVSLPDGWNWYDIDAQVPSGATEDQIRLMFQRMLAERFKLKVHKETKDLPAFRP